MPALSCPRCCSAYRPRYAKIRRLGMAVDGEHAALFMEFVKHDLSAVLIVVKHDADELFSSAFSRTSRESLATGQSIHVTDPLRRFVTLSFIVTPMRSASTLYFAGDLLDRFRRGSRNQNARRTFVEQRQFGLQIRGNLNRRADSVRPNIPPARPPGRRRSNRARIRRSLRVTISRIAACTRFS